MFLKLLRDNRPLYLGRWGAMKNREKSKQFEFFNCDTANHDHCGGQLCSFKNLKKLKEPQKIINKLNQKKIKD